jgi:hypothetical protein
MTQLHGSSPILPTFFPNGITEERFDLLCERLIDRIDAAFMSKSDFTQEQYDAWFVAMRQWEADLRANGTLR